MNIEEHLILVKKEDKTEQIQSCEYEQKKWTIKYHNNSKVYQYNYQNVDWFKNPKLIDPTTSVVYEKNIPISGVIRILDFGQHTKLMFKTGYKRLYPNLSIVIEETCLTNQNAHNCFEYLKRLADQVSIKLEGDRSFLGKQYSMITNISPRSVLSAYLERKPLRRETKQSQVIFPFGFNLSQKAAAEKAMLEQMSVIEGPPGTGKTQTILNIISNAVIQGKTVAIVSNNNSATANVLEKLQKYEVDFMAAYLGNNENKAKFFAEQNENYPNMDSWTLSESDAESIKNNLSSSRHELDKMLEYKNESALLKHELSEIKTENKYFNNYYSDSKFEDLQMGTFFSFKADRILKVLMEYKRAVERGKVTLRNKLYNLFVYGIYSFKIYKYPPEIIVSYLQKTYYDAKMNELQKQIGELDKKLENFNFDKAMENYSFESMRLFKAKLVNRYDSGGNRTAFNNDVLWKDFDRFIKEYPVILSTTHSLRNCAAINYLFDYVLIDEASQVDIVTGALALSCAKNAVIVGDLKQLPNVVPTEVATIANGIYESFELDQAYHYSDHSLLSSIISLYEDIPKTLLREHYRCHPKIIGFCNQKFYNNELIVLTDENEEDKPLILYKTTRGNHARGKFNQRQIDAVFEEIIPEQKINAGKQSVGIISPYRLQADELQKTIGNQDLEADTVHKYQGREKEIIIITTVANRVEANDFVDDPNLINVAVSRAVDKLVVVVAEGSENWQGTNIGDLVRYINYNNFEVIESSVYSVFDLLYSSYSEKLLEVMKNSKQVSTYHSENLMNAVIEKVLGESVFQSLDHLLHQPLRMLIKDPVKLSEEDRKYAMNILTHTDFVIFSKLDKMPVLVVEVDGHAYHADNPVQLKRDEMKDRILNKYGIPIIRMKTTESGEEQRLRNKLEELLGL
ncbi:AAA family ATPase [Aquibacillus halophilus]|uniref:AAA family ATPase n=1 Tax=Aquibacillus halophilus TaxID=930132 RepID=A0A6A8D7K8_9BACI|nr:AAA domain-containing protein [Aquibacillus halophilus]MRH41574.1 AAA family ATPase [Aquibacillus halophilus]